jgi:type II secretory ATPase GspE/PulE/Tfp pilus assembly ATPase PilB-like protein
MLRADPDYLLLGEIRDSEAAHAAIEASGSGRVLMSTIHAPDAIGTVTTLRNFGIADHQIASSLRIVVAQRLVRRLCQHCRRVEKIADADGQWLASVGLSPSADQMIWLPAGCDKCGNLGYDGRIGAFEVWRLTDEDYDAIVHHADERNLRKDALSRGLQSLLSDGWTKVAAGITTLSELKLLSATYHFGTT